MTTTDEQPAQERKMSRAEISPLEDPLAFIVAACHSYLPAIVKRRWCTCELSLRFTGTGMVRVGQIFGWITGLAGSPDSTFQDFAKRAAKDICGQFDYLAMYGGQYVDEVVNLNGNRYEIKTPRYIVELSDDGTLNGFSVLWLSAIHPDQKSEVPEKAFDNKYADDWLGRGPFYRWAFSRKHSSMNGACLYSGPGQGQTFNVSLSNRLWAIHT